MFLIYATRTHAYKRMYNIRLITIGYLVVDLTTKGKKCGLEFQHHVGITEMKIHLNYEENTFCHIVSLDTIIIHCLDY